MPDVNCLVVNIRLLGFKTFVKIICDLACTKIDICYPFSYIGGVISATKD